VETAVRFPGLYLSLPEEEHEAKLVARAERAEAARVAKEEEEAAARAEEERARKEAEEEKRRAAEEAYANSKPKTLDEAVEHAVRTKMALEKAALESEYKAREEQLMEKISVLEAQLAG
jgi:colicin import membrane protein